MINLVKKRNYFFNKSDLLDDEEIKMKLNDFKKKINSNFGLFQYFQTKTLKR